MKKTLIALASVAALGAAHADVTLYGVIDAAATSVSAAGNSDANNPGNINTLNSYASGGAGVSSLTGKVFNGASGKADALLGSGANGRVNAVANGLLQGSRWGMKGSEDLGQGLKANFVLESALNIAGGTNPNDHLLLANYNSSQTGAGDSGTNGQMFDRQATVGLAGDFGSFDVGFQPNDNIDANASIDPFALGGISPVGFYSSWNGGGSSYTRMASNSIKYKTSMGMAQVEAFYAMGGVSGNAGAGSQVGLMTKVQATPRLSLTLAASRMNDDVSFDSAPITINNSAGTGYNKDTGVAIPTAANAGIVGYSPALAAKYYNATTAIFGGSFQASSNLMLKAGYITITQSNPSNGSADALIFQNNGVPINPNAIVTQPFATNQTRTIGFVGGTYDLTPTNHLTAAYYRGTLGAYTANAYGGNSTSPTTQVYSSNTYNYYAAAYVMDLSKKTNVYVAASYESIDNPGIGNAAVTAGTSGTTPMNQTTSAGTTQTLIAVGLRTSF